jgi:hypothetical protein
LKRRKQAMSDLNIMWAGQDGEASNWEKNTGIDGDTGDVYFPASHVGDEGEVVTRAELDSEMVIVHLDHPFVRASWMAREFPKFGADCLEVQEHIRMMFVLAQHAPAPGEPGWRPGLDAALSAEARTSMATRREQIIEALLPLVKHAVSHGSDFDADHAAAAARAVVPDHREGELVAAYLRALERCGVDLEKTKVGGAH